MDSSFEVMLQRQPESIDFGFLFHKQILPKHREELLNWIYQLNEKFSFSNSKVFLEPYFQAVALVDLYCSRKDVPLEQYQLVGSAAFWIATKNCLTEAPSGKALVYLSMDSFTINELFVMERLMLFTIDWRIQITTAYHVLYLIFSQLQDETENKKNLSEADAGQFLGLENQFQVASQVLVSLQKDLMLANQSSILLGFASALATFLCFNNKEMEAYAVKTLRMALDMNIEQDLMKTSVADLQPFFKSNISVEQLQRLFQI